MEKSMIGRSSKVWKTSIVLETDINLMVQDFKIFLEKITNEEQSLIKPEKEELKTPLWSISNKDGTLIISFI